MAAEPTVVSLSVEEADELALLMALGAQADGLARDAEAAAAAARAEATRFGAVLSATFRGILIGHGVSRADCARARLTANGRGYQLVPADVPGDAPAGDASSDDASPPSSEGG